MFKLSLFVAWLNSLQPMRMARSEFRLFVVSTCNEFSSLATVLDLCMASGDKFNWMDPLATAYGCGCRVAKGGDDTTVLEWRLDAEIELVDELDAGGDKGVATNVSAMSFVVMLVAAVAEFFTKWLIASLVVRFAVELWCFLEELDELELLFGVFDLFKKYELLFCLDLASPIRLLNMSRLMMSWMVLRRWMRKFLPAAKEDLRMLFLLVGLIPAGVGGSWSVIGSSTGSVGAVMVIVGVRLSWAPVLGFESPGAWLASILARLQPELAQKRRGGVVRFSMLAFKCLMSVSDG